MPRKEIFQETRDLSVSISVEILKRQILGRASETHHVAAREAVADLHCEKKDFARLSLQSASSTRKGKQMERSSLVIKFCLNAENGVQKWVVYRRLLHV